jgi:hypothetical protein
VLPLFPLTASAAANARNPNERATNAAGKPR